MDRSDLTADRAPGVRLLASLTSVNPLAIGRDALRLVDAGVDGLHVDISDGRSVPLLLGTPSVVAALRRETEVLLDLHLLVDEPERLLEPLARAGADRVTFHIESVRHPWRLVGAIGRLGMRAGVALDAMTPLAVLSQLGATLALVNLQTATHDDVQDACIPGMEARVGEARSMLPPEVELQVDGGVDAALTEALVRAGASEIVVGRAITAAADWAEAAQLIRDTFAA